MTIATTEPPRITTKMTKEQAEEITEAIRGNFDSLGKMLLQVQERKGFLALGYKSLESYCLTEFGKGKSRLYQVIEEARIEEEIISELAEETGQKSLKMPGTYLRALRDLSLPGQKIEAIKYANLLAEKEGRKRATKLHLEVAALKVGGQGSEQLRKSIEEMGFAKGVEVEFAGSYNKGKRGIIRKIDKKGQVYVEVYSGNLVPMPADVDTLKIVCPDDKPKNPTTEDTVSIGDSVKIFSSNNLQGKIGRISARISSKQALVKIDSEPVLIDIPYAELELIQVSEEQQPAASWDKDLSWDVLGGGSWFYSKDSCSIRSFGCPGITFHPDNKKKFTGPPEWLEWWRQRHGCELAGDLLSLEQIATLAMAAAIRMTAEEKQEFLQRINVLSTRNATKCEKTIESPEVSQDAKVSTFAEQAAEILVDKPLLDDAEEILNFPNNSADIDGNFQLKNTPESPNSGNATTPTEPEQSWLSLLKANNFSKTDESYFSEDEPTEVYRDWEIYDYNSMAVADIFHPDKGAFSIDFSLYANTEKQIIKPVEWVKNIINQVEDFCPGQLSLFEEPNPNWQKDWLDKNFPVLPEIGYSTTQGFLSEKIAEKLDSLLDKADTLFSRLNSKKIKRAEVGRTEKDIKLIRQSIKELEFFSSLKIGMLASHRRSASQIGIITNLTISTGGMPEVWVKWDEKSIETPEKLSLINIQDEEEEL